MDVDRACILLVSAEALRIDFGSNFKFTLALMEPICLRILATTGCMFCGPCKTRLAVKLKLFAIYHPIYKKMVRAIPNIRKITLTTIQIFYYYPVLTSSSTVSTTFSFFFFLTGGSTSSVQLPISSVNSTNSIIYSPSASTR